MKRLLIALLLIPVLGECASTETEGDVAGVVRLVHRGQVSAMAFSPDGKLVAVRGNGRVIRTRRNGVVQVWFWQTKAH